MGLILLGFTNLIFPLVVVGVLLKFLFSPRRGLLKHIRQELRERFGLEKTDELVQGAVWLHCASVGEVLSMRQTVSRLKELYHRPIL